ncbi:hypothetical protein LTR04_006301 [Oleoguttula sp. CCFEE 6159]|nr:hypothetical protein LTR04_006301 [Oleoguttula sp. CCFEE 6159]
MTVSSCTEEVRGHEFPDEEKELELVIREECAIAMGSQQHILTPSPPLQLPEKPKATFNIMAVTGDMASLNDFYRSVSVDAEVIMGIMALHPTAPSVSLWAQGPLFAGYAEYRHGIAQGDTSGLRQYATTRQAYSRAYFVDWTNLPVTPPSRTTGRKTERWLCHALLS